MKLIPLYRRRKRGRGHYIVAHAKVDDELYCGLAEYRWGRDPDGYPRRTQRGEDGKPKTIRMHTVVNQTPPGLDTDHINGNKLDNQRANLRSVTKGQNNANRGKLKNQKSQYKGVHWNASKERWTVTVGDYRGLFKREKSAARAYDREAGKRYGTYARFNFPNERPQGPEAARPDGAQAEVAPQALSGDGQTPPPQLAPPSD